MNLGYSIQDIIFATDTRNWLFLGGLFVGGLFFYVYYVEALRMGFKHKCAGMPWQTNMWNFANDSIYVFSFTNWFSTTAPTSTLLARILWWGMVFWLIMECIIHYQAMKWDTEEMFPMVKKKSQAILIYIALQVGFNIMYMWLLVTINDPFFYILFATTYTGCLLFNFHFIHKRQSTKGQSQTLVWSLACTPLCFWFFCLPAINPAMNNVWTYAFGAVQLVLSFGYAFFYQSFPKYTPENNRATAGAA